MFIYETARCTEVSADRQNSTNSISFLPPLFNKTNFQAVAPTASCLLRFLLQAFQPQYFYLHMFMRIILLSRRAWRHLNIIITNSVYLWALWISSSPLSHLNITITNSMYIWTLWISPTPIIRASWKRSLWSAVLFACHIFSVSLSNQCQDCISF
jgi:hypothetical protein